MKTPSRLASPKGTWWLGGIEAVSLLFILIFCVPSGLAQAPGDVPAMLSVGTPSCPTFGQDWQATGAPSNYWTSVACSADGSRLVAAAGRVLGQPAGFGVIYLSTNAGMTWALSTAPTQDWAAVSSSADGGVLVAAAHTEFALGAGSLFVSTNAGLTWTRGERYSGFWRSVASSADGSKLVAVASIETSVGGPRGQIAVSTNSGATWTAPSVPDVLWVSVASSADGARLVAAVAYDFIYTSTNSGLSWTTSAAPAQAWSSVASYADGSRLVAANFNTGNSTGSIYISTNSGGAWRLTGAPVQNWASVACSADGTKLVAVADTHAIYFSCDSGGSWAPAAAPGQAWSSVASTTDSAKLFAASAPGSIYRFVQPPGTLLWTFPVSPSYGSPAIGLDGTIYVGSQNWNLYALTPQGSNVWQFRAGGEINSSPAVAEDGAVYFGCGDGRLYALNANGTLRWTWGLTYPGEHGIRSSPAIAADGTIYIGFNNSLHAISPDGTRVWEFALQGDADGSPAIALDGTIYMLSSRLYAIRPDGSKKWEFAAGHQSAYYNWQDSAAIADDGTIYFIGNSALYALDPSGTERWHSTVVDSGSSLGRTPAIGSDQTVFAILGPSAGGGRLLAFTSEGAEKWSVGDSFRYDESPSPSVDALGIAYFAGIPMGSDGYLHCAVNPDGTTNWLFRSRDYIMSGLKSAATVGQSGTIYVWGRVQGLYAFAGTSPPPRTGWPMPRQNARQTGKVEWPRLRNLQCTPESIRVEVLADPGWTCTVQVSSNLFQWVSVTNFVAETNRTLYTESVIPGAPQRFYRVVSPAQ